MVSSQAPPQLLAPSPLLQTGRTQKGTRRLEGWHKNSLIGEAEAVCARKANEIFFHYFTSAVTYLATFWEKKKGGCLAHLMVTWENKLHNPIWTSSLPPPFMELLLLITTSYSVDFFGLSQLSQLCPSYPPTAYSLQRRSGKSRRPQSQAGKLPPFQQDPVQTKKSRILAVFKNITCFLFTAAVHTVQY